MLLCKVSVEVGIQPSVLDSAADTGLKPAPEVDSTPSCPQ